ncbi:MAG: T9SS type A sorting domain-containing protein [Candidatus Delongbacteria bacterium]
MKRFVTLLTVSITMAGLAFAGHPVVEPEVEGGVGFPFHPGAYITSSLNADFVWNECFCMPADPQNPNYTEFPAIGDPAVVQNYHVLRLTGMGNVPTYLQSPASYSYDGLVLDMTFYFAASECADALGYYITPTALTAAPAGEVLASGLSFIIDRTGSTSSIEVYDDGALVTSAVLPVYDSNFHLLRVRYDELNQKVRIDLFEMLSEVNVLPWTTVSGPSSGYVGFGGFADQGCFQYIDDICLYVTDDNGYEVSSPDAPVAYTLAQNFPNPFNPTTTISFTMPETGAASLKVFDLAGREVATLVNGLMARGEQNVVFDASNLNSGVYFYTFETAGVSETRKMVLIK